MRLIDADALEMAPDENNVMNGVGFMGRNCGKTIEMVQAALRNMIDNAPTIEAEPVRHGKWIGLEYDGYADGCPVYDLWECSECRMEHEGEEDTLTDYCPCCGAKMDLK